VVFVSSLSWNQVPIVPYGGATSIEGHTLAPHGGVCIDMSSMKVNIKLHNKEACNCNVKNDETIE
jgi:D-lactate dehydrogenase (cytochrome)